MEKEYVKTTTYNGNDLFNIDCNLYGYEYIKHQDTLQELLKAFYEEFEEATTKRLKQLGIKFIEFTTFSPNEYNFLGDSIDPTIQVTDYKLYIKALQRNKLPIDKLLKANKSYDGYMALTEESVDEEIEKAKHHKNEHSPDTLCLSYLLAKQIDYKTFNIEDYIVYDYECQTEGCTNEKENYEDEYCEECTKKDNEDNKLTCSCF